MASLSRWDPFRMLARGDQPLEDVFRELFQREDGGLQPAAEVSEAGDEVTVKLTVPGVDKDQLQITVQDDTVSVRGEVKQEKEEKKKSYYRKEIRYGAFQRTVPLPTEVQADGAHAELKNGVLTITLHKSAEQKARTVPVTGA
jgi:HSP20 family protein